VIDFESAPDSSEKPKYEERTLQLPDVDVPGILKVLNEKQREAVLITEGPLMVRRRFRENENARLPNFLFDRRDGGRSPQCFGDDVHQ
jgi:hypothetical protein